MSNATKVEQRVVQMKFDNKGFAAGVENTLGALTALQNGILNAENLTKALGKVDLSGLVQTIENVGYRFSTMGIMATTVLQNIASEVYYTAKSMANSLSIDQMYAGWDKYNDKTLAVQTIMSATGKSIQEVENEMEKLQWFTDETSYNFVDMVGNIGKFTSAGLKLEDSRVAMQGIALWAAESGVNATDASRAMFQLSQAISMGAIKGNDWMSIESLTMATEEFKNKVLETAVAMGKLEKVGDKYKAKGANATHLFDANSFRTFLSDNWFDKELFMKVMKMYGDYADKVREFQEENGIDTAAEAMEKLGDAGDEFGKKVFEAGQVTRTFEDAINATKDAVSSGWSKTWQLIFGNLEEAKEVWGDLVERLWDIFAAGGEARNEILQLWRDLGGRETLIQSFRTTWDTVKETIDNVKAGFQEIFPPLTGERLRDITDKIYDLAYSLQSFNDEHMADFFKIGKGIGAALDIVSMAFKKIVGYITGAADAIGEEEPLFETVVRLLSKAADILIDLDNKIKEKGFFGAFKDLITDFVKYIPTLVSTLTDHVLGAIERLAKYLGDILGVDFETGPFSLLVQLFQKLSDLVTGFLPEGLKSVGDGLIAIFSSVSEKSVKVFEWFSNVFSDFSDVVNKGFGWAIEKIGKAIEFVGNILGKLFDAFSKLSAFDMLKMMMVMDKIVGVLKPANDVINRGGTGIVWFFQNLPDIFENLGYAAERSAEWIDYFTRNIQGMLTGVKVATVLELAAAIFLFAQAAKTLGELDPNAYGNAIGGILVLLAGVAAIIKLLNSVSKSKLLTLNKKDGIFTFLNEGLGGIGPAIVAVAAAMIMLAGAMKIMSTIDWDKMIWGLVTVGTLLAELWAFFNLKWGKDEKAAGIGNQKVSISAIATIITIANAMILLAAAMKILSTIDIGGILKGLGAIGGLLLAIWAFINNLNSSTANAFVKTDSAAITLKEGKGTKGANLGVFAGIFLLATSIVVLAAAMKIIETMDLPAIAKGLGTIIGLMVIVVGAMWALGKVVEGGGMGLMMAAGAIQTVAIAILMLSAGLVVLSIVQDTERINTALGVMAKCLIAVFLFFGAISKIDPLKMLGGAAGFALIAAGIVLIAGALLIVTNLATQPGFVEGQSALLGAFVTIAAAVGILGMLQKSGSMALAGAAMLLMSSSLLVLSVAMKIVATIPFNDAISSLTAFAVALVVLAGAAGIMSMFWAPLLIGAGVMLAIGAAGIVAAMGLEAIGKALPFLATGLEAIVKLIITTQLAFVNMEAFLWAKLTNTKYEMIHLSDIWGNDMASAFESGMAKGATGEGADALMNITHDKIYSESGFIGSEGGKLLSEEYIGSLMEGQVPLGDITSEMGDMVNSNMAFDPTKADFAGDLMDQIYSQYPELKEMAGEGGDILFEGITAHTEEFSFKGQDAFENYIKPFTGQGMQKDVKKAANDLDDTFSKELDGKETGNDYGVNVKLGAAEGLNDSKSWGAVDTQIHRFTSVFFDKLCRSAGIKSPSTKARDEVGRYITLGIGEGMLYYASTLDRASGGLMDKLFASLGDSLRNTNSLVADNLTLDPTITPLMDLSQIQNGADRINSLLGNGSFRVNGTLGSLSMANENIMASIAANLSGKDKSSERVVGAINSLKSDIKDLGDYVSKLEIRMDSGALVGSIASPMDKQLGIRAARNRRERPR